MDKQKVLKFIKREKLVPVIRATTADEALQAVETLASNGIKIFEITLTTPGAIRLIHELDGAGNSEILIGAGTVLSREQAEKCVEAGAKFIVSPIFNPEIVRFCGEKEIAVMPGALTPTEVFAAWSAGADCVKVFPCEAMGGAKYLKALKSVFPNIEVMPTGGVSLETIADFLQAGAFAVGVGADLVDVKAIRAGNLQSIAEKAQKYLEIVNNI
ncbi:MAG: bifunctional 4-hydroxy-2-oxoglutarate aldolase/2-dehydro-3-deoxy-phosphogluconate aldolase [Pyrinomonadaceae bacterium]